MKIELLGDIANVRTGKYDANHGTLDGAYKFYTCAFGQFKAPTYSFEGEAIVLPGNGANVGEVFFNEGGKFEAYQRTYVVENIKAYPKYIYMYFKSFWKDSLKNTQYGSATNYIRMDNLTKFKIPLPPLPYQIRIAEILSQAESLIAQRKQSINLLDELLKSTFLEMFGDPVKNEKEWGVDSLSSFGTLKNGLNYTRDESGQEIKTLGVGDFKSLWRINDTNKLSIISLSVYPSKEYFLQDEDLIFVRSNGNKELIGRCIVIYTKGEKVTFSGFCIRYRTFSNRINTTFLAHLFRIPSFKKKMLQNGRGANIQNINQQLLENLKIPVPPIELQSKFATIVEKVESLKNQYQQSLTELQNMYGVLSQKAFKGELSLNANNRKEIKNAL